MKHFPAVQEAVMVLVDTILAPKVIVRQVALLLCLEVGFVTTQQLLWFVNHILLRPFHSKKVVRLRQLRRAQRTAMTQDEWMDLAEQIDHLQGHDVWRTDPECQLYERERIASRIDEYVHLMRRRQIFELMFLLRGGSIGRNSFGLLHEGLFTKAMAGTKVLVETYHNVVCSALDFCCDAPDDPDDPVPTEARLAFFNETRHSYGRTALLLSGGAALGYYHFGVVRALMDEGLLPRVMGGSSAGSMVCAMLCTRTDEECTNDMFLVKGTNAPGHSGRIELTFFRPIQKPGKQHKHSSDPRRQGLFGALQEVAHNEAGGFSNIHRMINGFLPSGFRRAISFILDVLTGHREPSEMFKSDTEFFAKNVR